MVNFLEVFLLHVFQILRMIGLVGSIVVGIYLLGFGTPEERKGTTGKTMGALLLLAVLSGLMTSVMHSCSDTSRAEEEGAQPPLRPWPW